MRKLAIRLIQFYQKATKDRPARCKYFPSCSNYALQAYKKFNFFYASLLTFWRILRCNPFSKGGYDPVPLSRKEKQALKNTNKEVFDSTKNIFEESLDSSNK